MKDFSKKENETRKDLQGMIRLKHIEIFNSSMIYNGDHFYKKSEVINCRDPFFMDNGCIDYG